MLMPEQMMRMMSHPMAMVMIKMLRLYQLEKPHLYQYFTLIKWTQARYQLPRATDLITAAVAVMGSTFYLSSGGVILNRWTQHA